MKFLAATAALTVAIATTVVPAFARTSYVIDDAHMLSTAAIAQINQKVGDLNAQTHKEVVVVTTPSLNGETPLAAAERAFAQQQVNGVEIFIAKAEKKIEIVPDRASARFFPSGSFTPIYQAMAADFRAGNIDQGVETGVDLIVNTYRGHESSLRRQPVGAYGGVTHRSNTGGGFSMAWIWWIIALALIFFIIRGIFRAMSGPRMMPPGYGGPGYGGPGYGGGGPGYGMGGGMGMGGGGFWSGLLGGLGGAWLGNELFGGNRNNIGDGGGYGAAGMDPNSNPDASGWQNDAGQADTSNAAGGGWGDSGGGDSGGGWGGGDGGGGGGGGDSGGGW
jgi:uncharacterized membrane protein YgcG